MHGPELCSCLVGHTWTHYFVLLNRCIQVSEKRWAESDRNLSPEIAEIKEHWIVVHFTEVINGMCACKTAPSLRQMREQIEKQIHTPFVDFLSLPLSRLHHLSKCCVFTMGSRQNMLQRKLGRPLKRRDENSYRLWMKRENQGNWIRISL